MFWTWAEVVERHYVEGELVRMLVISRVVEYRMSSSVMRYTAEVRA